MKEELLEEMEAQRKAAGIELTSALIDRIERKGDELLLHHGGKEKGVTRARRVIVGIGRSGNFRRLGVPGEDMDKVFNRLYDPKEFAGKHALVVGGGDTAIETAIALAGCGAKVTLSYRKPEFSRPKPENLERLKQLLADPDAEVLIEKPTSERVTTAITPEMIHETPRGSITLALSSQPLRIEADKALIKDSEGKEVSIPNDVVFTMLEREAPLDFFRRSGIHIRGEWRPATWITFIAFVLFCVVLYHWKSNHPQELPIHQYAKSQQAFPFNMPKLVDSVGGSIAEWSGREGNLLYTIKRGLGNPSFYYTLAYCACVTASASRESGGGARPT